MFESDGRENRRFLEKFSKFGVHENISVFNPVWDTVAFCVKTVFFQNISYNFYRKTLKKFDI